MLEHIWHHSTQGQPWTNGIHDTTQTKNIDQQIKYNSSQLMQQLQHINYH
jgi:hypothetical protein